MREHRGRPHVGMALYGDLTYDSRVRREARTLALAGYDVSIACLADNSTSADLPQNVNVIVHPPPNVAVLPGVLNPFRAPGGSRVLSVVRGLRWLRAYAANLRSWGRAVTAQCAPVDVWHAHDLTGLVAVAQKPDRDTPVVYDVHDLFLESGTASILPRPARGLLRRYEARLVSGVAALVTVNDGLAEILRGRYGAKRIEVLHNYPDRWSPPSSRPRFIREAAAIPDEAPIILYHGVLATGRGIEQVIRALQTPELDNVHLVLMGFGERRDAYSEAAGSPSLNGRVHVLDPVSPADLLSWVASANVGAVLHPGSRLNDYNKTPNKLFECIAAGIPVVASDFPLMRRIVVDDPAGMLGAVCDPSQVEDIASAFGSILALDARAAEGLRARCIAAAHSRWNWQSEAVRLTALYDELVARPN